MVSANGKVTACVHVEERSGVIDGRTSRCASVRTSDITCPPLHSSVSSGANDLFLSFATWCGAEGAMFVFHRHVRSMSPWCSRLAQTELKTSQIYSGGVAKRRRAHVGTHTSLSVASSKCGVGSRDGDADAPCWLRDQVIGERDARWPQHLNLILCICKRMWTHLVGAFR